MNPRSRRADVGKLLPPETDWRTSDDQEILKRQLRAREEKPRVVNQTPAHGIFSNFEVHSRSGLSYQVEIRDVANRQFACTCTDFRINGLRTCKHVEAVLLTCMRRNRPDYTAARRGAPSPRIDIVPDLPSGRLQIERNLDHLPDRLKSRFDAKGLQLPDLDPADLVREAIESGLSELRVSVETTVWLAARERALDSLIGRRNYEAGVAAGRYPAQETLHPLFPYQREGMLHLAFKERALLADEMGLGKTIQAIAACALLHRIGRARRGQKQGQAEIGTEASVRTSLCFGLYDWLDGQELGFARSVTDRVAFAWLGDVVIDSALPADCARSPSARA